MRNITPYLPSSPHSRSGSRVVFYYLVKLTSLGPRAASFTLTDETGFTCVRNVHQDRGNGCRSIRILHVCSDRNEKKRIKVK